MTYEDTNRERREYNDQYQAQLALEPQASLGTRAKAHVEAFVTGLLVAGLWDAFRRH